MGWANEYLNRRWIDSEQDKEFNRDVYKQIVQKMLSRKQGLEKLILYLGYRTYHSVFKIIAWLSKQVNSKAPRPLAYRVNKPKLKITVAVVTRNRYKYLESCLHSLLRQSVEPSEVVIVDNGSTDKTKEVVRLFSKLLPIKYFTEPRIGTAYARNRAIDVANEKIVAFIDDDCLAAPDWLLEMYKGHQKFPGAAAIQGGCRVHPFEGVLSYVYEVAYYHWLKNLRVGRNNLLTIDTANVSFKKDFVEKFNIRFDPMFKKYCDDDDFCQQLIYNNQQIIYHPKALLRSRRRKSVIEFFRERYRKGFAKAFFDQKWSRRIEGRFIYLKGKQIRLPGIYKRSNFKLKNILNSPDTGYLQSFFNTLNTGKVLNLRIWWCLILFENLYSYGYLFMRMRTRFDILNKPNDKNSHKAIDRLSLSVMIITKDRYERLNKTLQSLTAQSKPPDEVIIIDSSEKINLGLSDRFKSKLNIKHIYESRPGYGVARNRGLFNCTGDIIATIDDDAVAAKDWCENISKAHHNTDAVAVQGRIVCMPERSSIAFVEQIRLDKWFLGNIGDDFNITTISTKNVSFKVKKLLQMGIQFREDRYFGKYGSEDLDIADQILSENGRIVYEAGIRIFHSERQNLFRYLGQQFRKGRSNAFLEYVRKPGLKKQTYYLPVNKYLEPIILIKIYPYSPKFGASFLIILFLYYLSLWAYDFGKKRTESWIRNYKNWQPLLTLNKPTHGIKKIRNDHLGVVAVNSLTIHPSTFLQNLSLQTVLPGTVYIFVNKLSDEMDNIISFYKRYFRIVPVNADSGYTSVLNSALKEQTLELLTLLDLQSFFKQDLLETISESQIKLREYAAIQGRIIRFPRNKIRNIIVQFNYQTLIRNLMNENRNMYWKLISGQGEKKMTVNFVDLRNLSLNLDKLRKAETVFSANAGTDEEIQIGLGILNGRLKIRLDPGVVSYYPEKIGINNFKEYAMKEGEKNAIRMTVFPSTLRERLRINSPKKLLAFIYYCFKNKYFFQLLPAVLLFVVYQIYFTVGQRQIVPITKRIPGVASHSRSNNWIQ